MGDVGGCEAPNGSLGDGGVNKELVFGERFGLFKIFFAAGGVEDSLRAGLERHFELRTILVVDPVCMVTTMLTIGMISAGSLFSLCARCSLKAMRCAMSMSQ